MKTLENYGVQEMNAIEMKETDGGFPWVVGVLLGGLAYELITEGFAKCAQDFNAGFQSTQ